MSTGKVNSALPWGTAAFVVGAVVGVLADRLYLTSNISGLMVPKQEQPSPEELAELQKQQWREQLLGRWMHEMDELYQSSITYDFRANGITYIGSWNRDPNKTNWEAHSVAQWAWIDERSIEIKEHDYIKYYTVAFDDERLILFQFDDSRRVPNSGKPTSNTTETFRRSKEHFPTE